jgi:hypothetical protein
MHSTAYALDLTRRGFNLRWNRMNVANYLAKAMTGRGLLCMTSRSSRPYWRTCDNRETRPRSRGIQTIPIAQTLERVVNARLDLRCTTQIFEHVLGFRRSRTLTQEGLGSTQ